MNLLFESLMKTLPILTFNVALGLALTVGAYAQVAPPQHLDIPYPHDTGYVQNSGTQANVIDSFTVDVPGAKWLRLYFSKTELPKGTEVRITSWMDGDVQVLTGQNMVQWQNSSCYLNGAKLQVDIYAEVGADPARLILEEVDAGTDPPQFSICGPTDDRILTFDNHVARMLPAGCTGWLFFENSFCTGCFLSAGHCAGVNNVVHFNVPLSDSSGAIVPPLAIHQYSIDFASVQSFNGPDIGEDWMVFGCFDNPITGLQPLAAQGLFGIPLATSIPTPVGQGVVVTGYGVDNSVFNQVQQSDVGPFVGATGNIIEHMVDTTGGNSGSPVIVGPIGEAIGIHTDGGCNLPLFLRNHGTSITHPDLQTAIANPQGICLANCTLPCTPDGIFLNHSCLEAFPFLVDTAIDLTVCKAEPDFFTFIVPEAGTLDVLVAHTIAQADIDIMLYDANQCNDDQTSGCAGTLACGFTNSDDEFISWFNGTGADLLCVLRVLVDPSSTGDGVPYHLTIAGLGAGGGTGCQSDTFSPNHSCGSAAVVVNGTYPLAVCKSEPDYFSFTVSSGATFDVTAAFSNSVADLDMMLYDASLCTDDQNLGCAATLGCGFTGSDNEVISWVNTTGSDMDCILRVHVWPPSSGDGNTYDLSVAGIAGGAGVVAFCDPANSNSTGGPVSLTGTLGLSGLHLEASGGPSGQFGFFLVSAGSHAGVTVSDGLLCLSSPIGRYNSVAGGARDSLGQFDVSGVLVNLAGTSSSGTGFDVPIQLPSPPGGAIVSGSTWNYQLWYRDGPNSNWANGVQVDHP